MSDDPGNAHAALDAEVPEHLRQKERIRLAFDFSAAVHLIAFGLHKREDYYAKNHSRCPYNTDLQLGIQRMAALTMRHGNKAAKTELLSNMAESNFIRAYCTQDISAWIENWNPAAQEALKEEPCLALGPLVDVSGRYFSLTEDCEELLAYSEENLEDLHERKVYNHLKAGGQVGYVFGRKLLILHLTLTGSEYGLLCAGNYPALDASFQGTEGIESISIEWLSELLEIAYEPAPLDSKRCPTCGWTMELWGKQPMCLAPDHTRGITAQDFDRLTTIEPGSYRLHRGVMRCIGAPGALEFQIAHTVESLGLPFEWWPQLDTCDIFITLPDGRTVAVDAKDYKRMSSLAARIAEDNMREILHASKGVFVVPNEISERSLRTVREALRNKQGYFCTTVNGLANMLTKEMEKESK